MAAFVTSRLSSGKTSLTTFTISSSDGLKASSRRDADPYDHSVRIFCFPQHIQVALNEKRSYEGNGHLSHGFSNYVHICLRMLLVKV